MEPKEQVGQEELKEYSQEDIAAMLGEVEGQDEAPDDAGKGEAASSESIPEQDVEGDQSGQGDDTAANEEQPQVSIATKSGKGSIPYRVLDEERKENAELRRKIEELEKRTVYQAEVPGDYGEKLAELDQQLATLGKQFEEGDIVEWDEFLAKQKEILQQRSALERSAVKAEISREMTEQQNRDAWLGTVAQFVKATRDGIDYASDEGKRSDLDRYVKLFASDQDNSDQSYQWFLDTAHAAVMAKHGMVRYSPHEDKKPVAEKEVAKAPFNSLSDIPGGTPPAKDELEQLGELSGAVLRNKFLKDPSLIDKYLLG